MTTKLSKVFESKGLTDANDYVRVYTIPGVGTVDRYLRGEQKPLTRKGNWRKAALKIAANLSIPVEVAFPGAAEERQQLLDELSIENFGGLRRQGLLDITTFVRCPKETSNVSVKTECAQCEFFDKVEGDTLHCNYRSDIK